MGYRQVAGNRFAKTMPDIPVLLAGGIAGDREAIIDVMVPAYTSRARQNVKVSEDFFSTEVPGPADRVQPRAGDDRARDAPAQRRGAARGAPAP
jgi:hypothetical protein